MNRYKLENGKKGRHKGNEMATEMLAFLCLAILAGVECLPADIGSALDVPDGCLKSSVTPFRCPSALPEDSLMPHPDDCELFYYCLSEDTPICRSCPANLHFNPVERVCDRAERAGCKAGLDMAGVGTAMAEVRNENNISKRCNESSVTPVECPNPLPPDGLVPHPDDCRLFYYCVAPYEKPICRDCPANLHFNPIKRVCDRPDQAGCEAPLPSDGTREEP